jgi:hypothetical protein
MRDILNILDNITLVESTGLAGRKPGDKFKNSQGDVLSFDKIEFYPSEGGKASSVQIDTIIKQAPNVKWQNKRTAKTGGIAIATFTSDNGEVQYGFFKDDINPDPRQNKIKNEVDGYKFAGKAAEKVQSGLTPQDLLTLKRDNLTRQDIIKQLSQNLGANNPLVEVAIRVASGEEFPIKFPAPEGVSFTGFRDYFCEILQPMALQTGQYKGNAGEAAEIFLGGSFDGTLISFDAAKNAGLSDSILTNSEGKYIKISTKGGRGAEASVKNLIDSVEELQATPAGQKLLNKHKESIEILNQIKKQGQVNAPLYLGVKYNIIDQEEANTILRLRNLKPINLNDIDQLNLGDNLTKLAKERKRKKLKDTEGTEQTTNLFYHLLASVAALAANEVNNKTDFSETAADILNNGALVQVYTKAKQGEKEWSLDSFDTVYPGKSIKGVYLSAGKNYSSTGIKGNFTFLIDKGAGPEKDTEDSEDVEQTSTSISDKEFTQTADKIARGLRKPFKKKETKGVGREKQNKPK